MFAIGSSDVLSSVARETEPNWDADIRDDVYEECAKFGGVIHIYVDKLSQVCGVCGGGGRVHLSSTVGCVTVTCLPHPG